MHSTPAFACVVGAPRCGTTSLAGFLQARPDVCFSSVKEPHFFSQHDLSHTGAYELRRLVNVEYLDRFFPHRSSELPMMAEGSVSYLYAPERMKAVLRLWPDARFIIALRDPMAMLPSLHRRLLFTGDETVTDFEQAWAMTAERREGRAIPRTCIDPRALLYDELGRLGTHVGQFFDVVGRDRCFVALFDDLMTDPELLYLRMMGFLGLPVHDLPDFVPRRASRAYRIGWLQRLLKRPPMATRAFLAGEKFRHRVIPIARRSRDSALLQGVFAARKRLLLWNSVPAPTVALSDDLRRDIRDRLEGEVAKLEGLIGRDLSHWLDGTPSGHIARTCPIAKDAVAA